MRKEFFRLTLNFENVHLFITFLLIFFLEQCPLSVTHSLVDYRLFFIVKSLFKFSHCAFSFIFILQKLLKLLLWSQEARLYLRNQQNDEATARSY